MTVKRLRPVHDAATLATMYAKPHDHTHWADHVTRVQATIEEGAKLIAGAGVTSGADLACGDGAILRGLPVDNVILGDFAPGYEFTGPIEQTVELIPPVDVFVCCETLEHLDDPAAVLRQIRAKTRYLLLSTPVNAWDDDNPEHYWAWSSGGVAGLLLAAGFDTLSYQPVFGPVYQFGIWGAW